MRDGGPGLAGPDRDRGRLFGAAADASGSRVVRVLLLALLACLAAGTASAHKASDAYLRLVVDGDSVAGSLEVALRDLERAIGLDGDGDGAVTWAEARGQGETIAAYVTDRLRLRRDGAVCAWRVGELTLGQHGHGAYAVLPLESTCGGAGPPRLRYDLLFDRDPSHRALLALGAAGQAAGAVLSPDAPELVLVLEDGPTGLVGFFLLGLDHIAHGFDHFLFLLVILLPIALRTRRDDARVALTVLKILSAFTAAHLLSTTLALLGLVDLPARLVETAIPAAIALAAIDNLHPFLPGRRWHLAFLFGLIHGLDFASNLGPIRLPPLRFAEALLGFNLGIEAGLVVAAALFFLVTILLRRLVAAEHPLLAAGSATALTIAGVWLVDRALALDVTLF